MAAGDVRAGKAYVEISAQDQFSGALNKLQSKLSSIGDAASALGQQLALGGVALATGLFAASEAYAQMGDNIAKASTRTGVAAEQLSLLKYAAEQSGTDLETLEKGMNKLNKTIASAAGGNDQAIASLKSLGLSAADLINLKPDQAFNKIATAVSNIANPIQRSAAALNIFGKSGAQLLPLMNEGAEGIEALKAAGANLGLGINTADSKAAEEFGDRLDDLEKVAKQTAFALGGAVAPQIRAVVVELTGGISSALKWAEANRETIAVYADAALKAAKLAVEVGAAVAAFGALVGVAASVIGAVKAISLADVALAKLGASAAKAASFAAANPVILAVVGVAAIYAAITAWEEYGRVTERVAGLKADTHVAQGIADQAREARNETLGLLETLQKLNAHPITDPSDVATANKAIAELNKRYGDIGLSIDANTGKLNGFAEAQKKVTEEETKAEIARQLAIAKEAGANAQRKSARITDLANGSFLDRPENNARIGALEDQLNDQLDAAAAARDKAKELKDSLKNPPANAKDAPVFKGAKAAPQAAADDEDVEASKTHLKELADARKELDKLEEDAKKPGLSEKDRQIEEINKRYQEQIDLIKKLNEEAVNTDKKNGNTNEQKKLQGEATTAYQQQQAAINKVNQEQAEKDKKLAQEKQITELRLQEELAEKQGKLAEATALKKKVAEAEFEKSIEDQYKNDPAGRDRAIALHKQIADTPEISSHTQGGFNLAGGAGQSLQDGGVQDRIAKNTADTAKYTKKLYEKGGGNFG